MKCTKCLKKELNKSTIISQNMLCDECFDDSEKELSDDELAEIKRRNLSDAKEFRKRKPKAKIDMSLLEY